jgi:hypothetical protein
MAMRRHWRMMTYSKRTSVLVLLAAFLLSVALPCVAVARSPYVSVESYHNVSGDSGDPIDGERKPPINRTGEYIMEMQGAITGAGSPLVPASVRRPVSRTPVLLPLYVGVPGGTLFLVFCLPWIQSPFGAR